MRHLPPIESGSVRWILPLADRSAVLLIDAMLADDPRATAGPLAGQLAGDPPLVLWAVCQARLRDQTRLGSLSEVTEWLLEHALDTLRWSEQDPWNEGPLHGACAPCADRVAGLLELADLSALLAASEGEDVAEEAFLAGMLHDPGAWIALTAHGPNDSTSARLPESAAGIESGRAGAWVAKAAELLEGVGSPPPGCPPDACRHRAAEGRRRWLEAVEGPVDRLPGLMARLSRLRQLEARFEETLEREKLESLAEFAAGAGHEINNPLAIIGGRAQLLLRDETDPERRRELAVVNAQVKRAHEMIADVRLFARPPKVEPEPLDLVELVDALVADLAPQAAKQAVGLRRVGDAGPVPVEADPAQLNVALRALCRNALEAIGHDGQIEIAVRGAPDCAEIRVADDGPGILPEHRRHIFDPFYSSRQAGRGLGFGLSKCWRIVTNHGGRIEVESGPRQGTAFTITLPR